MKKKTRIHICRNISCQERYPATSKKSAYCCDACKAEHNDRRAKERDYQFIQLADEQKRWYHTLMRFKNGAIVDFDVFRQLNLQKKYLPPATINKNMQAEVKIGDVRLIQLVDNVYEIRHPFEEKTGYKARLSDTKALIEGMHYEIIDTHENKQEVKDPLKPQVSNELENMNKLVTEQQAEIVKLQTQILVRQETEKITRNNAIMHLVKQERVHINELMKLNPVIDKFNGTAVVDGFIFKKYFMHQTDYRHVNPGRLFV